ncbi:MAG: peptidylprolyl isomerase [Burkholderiales bacterium]|nr:peptidylprolyl isomerase [Burkholderiales bacterium]
MAFLKLTSMVALGLAGAIALPVCHAAEAAKPLAVVNGVAIPQARLDFVLKTQQAQGQKVTDEMRKQLRDALITREIVTQEAIKKGFDKTTDYKTQMDLAKQQVLVNAYVEDYLKKHQPTDAELQAEYEAVKKEQASAKEYKVRHILVRVPEDNADAAAAAKQKAESLLAQLAQGASFEDLAKENSDDAGSKAKGGELEWTDGGNLVKPFADAMKTLGKGETSKLVQTRYGYHIIRVEDIREPQFPAFDQVKDEVAKQLIGKQRDQLIDNLRKSAKIK